MMIKSYSSFYLAILFALIEEKVFHCLSRSFKEVE